MGRLTLVHREVAEGLERAGRLRDAGHRVEVVAPTGTDYLRRLVARPPDAYVIDLARAPSHGRDLALWLRQRKATRGVPLVFVGGDSAKVARLRELLPDAVYTEWRAIRGAVRPALARPPREPIVRAALAGYSGTPLPKKLGIKSGATVRLVGAPAEFERTLEPLPEGVRLRRGASGSADRVLLFARSRAELARKFPSAVRALSDGGGLWIAWPKKASGVRTDLTQQWVRDHGLARGLVDYKICAIDETWSGLQFARRRGP